MIKHRFVYIRPSVIKRMVKEKGKRISTQYLVELDAHVNRKLESAITYHNAGKKTIDMDCAIYTNIVRFSNGK